MADENQQLTPVDQKASKGGGKGKTVTVIIIVIVVIVLLGVGGYFLRNYFVEKTAEVILETGVDADVDVDGDTTTFSNESGTTEIEQSSTWPSDIPSSIPKYSDGKIVSSMTNTDKTMGMSWTVNIEGTSKSAFTEYLSDLASAGYAPTSNTDMGDAVIANHENDTHSILASYNGEDSAVSLIISENYTP